MTVTLQQPLLPGRTSFSCVHKTKSRYIYVVGGNTKADTSLDDVQRFDIYSKQLHKLPNLIQKRANCTLLVFENSLYCFGGFCIGGYNGQTVVNSIERLDLIGMKWVQVQNDYPHKACNFIYPVSNESFLIFGGWK